jgi:radical SAM superfamily enzyme YgiQ (UPF0313 family)
MRLERKGGTMKARIVLTVAPTYNRILPHLGLCSLKAFMRSNGVETVYMDLSAPHFHDPMLVPCLPYLSAQETVRGMTLYTSIGPILRALLQGDVGRTMPPAAAMLFRSWVGEMAKRVLGCSPDIIGFSVYESNFAFSLSMARAIKAQCPGIPIVFGGPYLFNPDIRRILAEVPDWVDFLVLGEGERTFLDLVSLLSGEAGVLPQACIRVSDTATLSGARPAVVEDPDDLPFPDYSEIPFRAYHENLLLDGTFLTCVAGAGEMLLPLLFGRGCPFRCSFCGHSAADAQYRPKSVGRVLEEIRHLHATLGCRVFRINDSLMNMKRAWLEDLCDALAGDGPKIYWYGHVRAGGMDDALALKMHRAGCRFMKFGIESGSNAMLRLMRKGTTAGEQECGVRAAHAAGMKTRASFIFNFPGERVEDLQETLDFVDRNRYALDAFRPSETIVVPESDLALRPDHYHISIERMGDSEPEAADGPLASLPVRWRASDTTDHELSRRRDWFVGEMVRRRSESRRVFDPPTFPEILSEALEGAQAFEVPSVQRLRWRREDAPGRALDGLLCDQDRLLLQGMDAGPMGLEEAASISHGDGERARAALVYLMSLGLVRALGPASNAEGPAHGRG